MVEVGGTNCKAQMVEGGKLADSEQVLYHYAITAYGPVLLIAASKDDKIIACYGYARMRGHRYSAIVNNA